ncbi:hypothetical protein MOD71_18705 [Bacillus haynesii]|uniref:hypothetical protein n=1 Tax=Bacillus haynesii TaxID=1925021 RepID=UPI0022803766|nr:hypothetical protein [Bacillus haynesii]MCY8737538.1 hypothetical protein [Bacillus haynesii]
MSTFHVLNEELDIMQSGNSLFSRCTSFISRFLGSNVLLELHFEPYMLLKAKSLCEDIAEQAEDEFKLSDLINLLYMDFIGRVKRSADLASLNEIYRRILVRRENAVRLSVHNGEKFELGSGDEAVYKILMKRDYVLRGEIFIYDVCGPDADMTIEVILETLLTDFVQAFMRGNGQQLISRLIEALD